MKLFCVSSNVPEFEEGEEYQAYYNGIEYRVIYEDAGEIIADYDDESGYIIAEFFNDGLVEFE